MSKERVDLHISRWRQTGPAAKRGKAAVRVKKRLRDTYRTQKTLQASRGASDLQVLGKGGGGLDRSAKVLAMSKRLFWL